MKTSRYNYQISYGEKVIFFNGLTEYFFEVPKGKQEIYNELINNPNKYKDLFIDFIDRLYSKGFVIDDNTDEQKLLDEKFDRVQDIEEYRIMILPTYQCNLRCWYCTQDHSNLWMSQTTMEEVKKFILHVSQQSEIKRIYLSWFGGEPLLGYDKILALTSYAKNLAEENSKQFLCDITTNGTLLNEERIVSLQKAGVTSYQITIDGDKATHNSIKKLAGGSAFDKALENINIISSDTLCFLRFNYTHDNLSPESIISDITSRIDKTHRGNIRLLLYKVWQESENAINKNDLEKLKKGSLENGFHTILPSSNLCYADQKNFACIFPDGKICKCDKEPIENKNGRIVNGDIEWSGDLKSHIPAFKNKQFPCRECKYVPICWGPCAANRAKLYKSGRYGKCWYINKDEEVRKMIINICHNKKSNSSSLKCPINI